MASALPFFFIRRICFLVNFGSEILLVSAVISFWEMIGGLGPGKAASALGESTLLLLGTCLMTSGGRDAGLGLSSTSKTREGIKGRAEPLDSTMGFGRLVFEEGLWSRIGFAEGTVSDPLGLGLRTVSMFGLILLDAEFLVAVFVDKGVGSEA